MHILVTGAAGFIGSHLAAAVLNDGHKLRIVDNFSTGRRQNLAHLTAAEFIEGDISDSKTAAKIVDGIDVVFHEAAIPSVARSLAEPMLTHKANIDGTITLLVAARDAGVKRFVYAGSSSAYGDTLELPKVETMPANPLSLYAHQKLTGEQYCKLFARFYGLETVVLRYFNVYGPRQDPSSKYAAVIPLFIEAMLRDEPLHVEGDGTQSRDFTFIDDVVQANLKAMVAPNVSGEVFNVGCGRNYTLHQLIQHLTDLTSRKPKVKYVAPR
ncbi:MAG TPA: NAD-dependent epimerase/dehydratase family protein, partial [Blastocatellia bacterium]|nr:NAD-dependent epimerase/dehydratase family protein [Blastocatellia bacterium]